MECFRHIFRFTKSPFRRNDTLRAIEIGAPTNFRKEELPPLFSDDDTLASNSHGPEDKDAMITAAECQPTTRQRIRQQVRRMSVKLPRPQADRENHQNAPDNKKACPEPAE